MLEPPKIPGVNFPEHIGNYRLVRELGRGSMGTVYLAYQESLGRDLALKVLAPEFTRDDEFVERFRREGKIAARLRHPHIVQVFDASDRDGHYYIAMEYLGSRTLKDLMTHHNGKLPLRVAVALGEQLLNALSHAHAQGVIHRDVKPANILITDQDEAALTDFSIAKIKTANKLTQTGMMIGTPEYMSPEQFEGKKVDGRADLYAVGVIMYEMFTGIQPYRGETTPEVMKAHFFKRPPDVSTANPEVSQALSNVVMKALEKDPEHRWGSANEMRQALLEAGGASLAETSLDQFLAAVTSGKISLDDANSAREKVKAAIDQGYRKNLSIMMVDLAGSSKIKLPNQTLHADRAFRDYRATINAVLKAHGCTSFDWSGDGAICIFQTPLPAVSAGLEIQSLVEEVARRHPDLPDRLLARIGVQTGEVYLDPRRSLGEFASRTVDQAGHIEKDCPPGAVHVGESTMDQTKDRIRYEKVGTNRDNVTVYRAIPGQVPARPATVALLDTPEPAPVPPKLHLLDDEPAVGAPRFCPGCGKPAMAGARFCPGCGYDMGSLIQPSPIAEPEPPRPAPVKPARLSVGEASPIVQRGPSKEGPMPRPPEPEPVKPEPKPEPAPVKRAVVYLGDDDEPGDPAPPSASVPAEGPMVHFDDPPRKTTPLPPPQSPIWWGWWVGVGAFLMASVGHTALRAKIFGVQLIGGPMMLGGLVGLFGMIPLAFFLTRKYSKEGSSWARQAQYAPAAFAILLLVILAALKH